ncbi:pilus assembly protein TadG-related protein [Zhongshania marina]|uniref:Putative Flp pilus-assembly TadG-like N-terminal domain-containing protein n=1 Tax=Zhongshania marina TaxID=2304603 RepID=A0A2S4HGM3_9GAMM|nr:pilus assembly protein TadG-related protein [Marortus luteolus]POP53133.1 hypothetical protein C0068_08570 [Marortus luteolus]
MQKQRPKYARPHHAQRGVATIFSIIMIILVLLPCLAITTDTGRIYFEKRSLQKNADLAALETALLYCRGVIDEDALGDLGVDTIDTLKSDRGNFNGNLDDLTATVSNSGYSVTVILDYKINTSLFGRILKPEDDKIELSASATAKACEPTALISIRSSIATVDEGIINSVLGGLLGTTLNLTVGDWQSLLDTNINLLSYFDALASEIGVTAGAYDTLLTTDVSLSEILDVSADVLQADGASNATVSALQSLLSDIPLGIPNIQLGEILAIQTDATETSVDVDLGVMQLIEGSIQLANRESGIVADVGIPLGIIDATVRAKITEPAQTGIGNPNLAEMNPYGSNGIFAQTSQVRTFISLDLPIVGSVLNSLDALLSAPLISEVSNIVNSLLSLDLVGLVGDILCLVSCVEEKDQIDIKILESPRVDIAINAGSGIARVKNADCDIDGTKTLDAEVSTSTVSVALGQFGSDTEDASNNVFSSDELVVEPIPIIDIGTIHVRKTCALLFCSYSYRLGAGWTSDKSLADRDDFAGGGIGLKLDTTILGDGPENLPSFENNPDDTYLPDVKEDIENSYQAFSADDPVASLSSTLTGIELEFYEPTNGNLLGGVLNLVGNVANSLVSSLDAIITTALSPILDPVVNSLLDTLGVNLANAEVGAALTCENDKVRLTN